MFEELGFYYVGPIDGHNMEHLLPMLQNLANSDEPGPVLVHCVTQKGKGYAPAEASADKYHGVVKFDVATGAQQKSTPKAPSYTAVFAKALIAEAKADDTHHRGQRRDAVRHRLDAFGKAFPERTLRCRHRRAACGHLLRRRRDGRDEAVRRDLFDVPATRL